MNRILLFAFTLAACGGGSAPSPPPAVATPAPASESIEARPDTRSEDDACARFNREQEELARNPKGPCPYCPCVCQPPYEIVCAPCEACDPSQKAPQPQ